MDGSGCTVMNKLKAITLLAYKANKIGLSYRDLMYLIGLCHIQVSTEKYATSKQVDDLLMTRGAKIAFKRMNIWVEKFWAEDDKGRPVEMFKLKPKGEEIIAYLTNFNKK